MATTGPEPDADAADDPQALRANAWCGDEAAHGRLDVEKARAWATGAEFRPPEQLLGATPLDLSNWRDPRVGWGLVVPDRQDLTDADKARGIDLPEALQHLWRQRAEVPLLRWHAGVREGRLARFFTDRPPAELSLSGDRGTGALAVPQYLLIAASPADIPWRVQYRLMIDAFVGRIDLDEAALGRYVECLLGDWSGTEAVARRRPVVWAVDHGHPDITRLMRAVLADKLADRLAADDEFRLDATGRLVGARATGADLMQALVERRPAFVMSSSHGATFPLDDPARLAAGVGLPVDVAHQVLDLAALGTAWNPAGCIWYAHACCSAGTDARSSFAGILQAQGSLAQTLSAVAAAGSRVAPLPRRLLGAAQPARAFVGHVEPTFDWTLRDPETGQRLTHSLLAAFYDGLHATQPMPIGRALHAHVQAVGGLLMDHADAVEAVTQHEPGASERAVRCKLVAMDRLALVLLGDPTVQLPAPDA